MEWLLRVRSPLAASTVLMLSMAVIGAGVIGITVTTTVMAGDGVAAMVEVGGAITVEGGAGDTDDTTIPTAITAHRTTCSMVHILVGTLVRIIRVPAAHAVARTAGTIRCLDR